MNNIKVLIDEKEIKKRVEYLGKKITKQYKGKELVLICILKGSTYFTADLSRYIENDITLDFMKVSSYGNSTESSGNIELKMDLSTNIKDKDVIIIEDIIDTGYTLKYLKEYLYTKKPNSIKICTLLDKKPRRKIDIEADYVGFEIEDKFVVGYGLDYMEKYRNLPYVGYIE